MRDSIWTFVLLAVFLGVFIPAFAGASTADMTTFSVANEETTISTANWTSVDERGSNYFDDETVYHNGSVVEETEYQWATTNGSIQAVDNGSLADASTVTISYSGERQDQWSKVLIPMVVLILGILIVLLLWLAGDTVVGAIGSGGGR